MDAKASVMQVIDRVRRHGRWWLAAAVLLAVIAAGYVLHWRTMSRFVAALDHGTLFMGDFVEYYHPMARRILESPVPIESYFYPAFFAVLLSPLGALSLPAAAAVWLVFEVAAALALALGAARLLRFGPCGVVLLAALVATSFPVLHNFRWGQVSTPITAGVLGAWLLLRRRRSVAAGVVLALAAAIKLYPAVFALPWLARGWRRALAAFAAAGVAFYVVMPAVVLGPGPWAAFERAIFTALRQARWMRDDVNSQFIANVGARWFTIITGRRPEAGLRAFLVGVGGVVAAGLAVLAWRFARRPDLRDRGLPLVALFTALPFVVGTSWPHYFVCLPFCQAALAAESWRAAAGRGRWPVVFPAVSMVLSSILLFSVFPTWGMYATCGLLFFANLALVPACAILALRPTGPAARST